MHAPTGGREEGILYRSKPSSHRNNLPRLPDANLHMSTVRQQLTPPHRPVFPLVQPREAVLSLIFENFGEIMSGPLRGVLSGNLSRSDETDRFFLEGQSGCS